MKNYFCLQKTIFLVLLIIQSSCSEQETYTLKKEFNICDQWHDGMTWQEFLKVRNDLHREELVKYVDKIEQQKMAQEAGIAVPKTYISSRTKVPVVGVISSLPSYVAKMTHLSLSQGLIIVKNRINIVTGNPITPAEVEKSLFDHLDIKPRDIESWALHQVKPGFMIQEYITERKEVKIQTVWGKAVIGEWRGGEDQTATTAIWGRYDREGNLVDGKQQTPKFWKEAVLAAEKMAQDTDALRVDFLVKDADVLLLNELEIWPESNWSSQIEELEARLNDGYRIYCARNRT